MFLCSTRLFCTRSVFRAIALGTSLAVGCTAVGGPVMVSSAATLNTPGNGTASATSQETYDQAKQKIDRLTTAMDILNRKVDRSLFEIDALSQRLGLDPATIFRFVRDEVRYEPYYGVLRGALGTLISHAGNSLDRSLLLAALLQKAGFEVEILRGTLDHDAAQALVTRVWEPVHPLPSAVPPLEALAPELGKALGLEPAKSLAVAEHMRSQNDAATKELTTYVNGETDTLLRELTAAGATPGLVTPNDELIAEAREHYWVHYRQTAREWTDLDPAFANSELGKSTTPAEGHFSPGEIPEDRYHHLRLTVTLRTGQTQGDHDTSMADSVMLDKDLRVADQQGADIILANQPDPTPDLLAGGNDPSKALTAIRGYQVILEAGKTLTHGKYFTLSGKLSDRPQATEPGPASFGVALNGLGGGLLGGLGAAPSAPSQAGGTRIVGEWANYELSSPGPMGKQPTRSTYRRDIVVPEIMRSWSTPGGGSGQTSPTNLNVDELRNRLLWSAKLTPITGVMNPDYAGYLFVDALWKSGPLLGWALQPNGSAAVNQAQLPPSAPIDNIMLASETTRVAESLIAERFAGLHTYFGRPGLIAYETTTSRYGPGLTKGYDVVAFGPRIISNLERAHDKEESSSLLHLLSGTVVTRLELLLLREQVAQISSNYAAQGIPNTTSIFEIARRQGLAINILKPQDANTDTIASLSVSDQTKAELSASLKAGNVLILPTEAVEIDGKPEFGWWQMNPQTGEFLGIMSSGRGQATVEWRIMTVTFIGTLATYGCVLHYANEPLKLALCETGVISGATGSFFPYETTLGQLRSVAAVITFILLAMGFSH
jgi:hypothetical protein